MHSRSQAVIGELWRRLGPAAACLALAALAPAAAALAPRTDTFTASADTYTKQNRPWQNFGTESYLHVRWAHVPPPGTQLGRHTFVKFDVHGLTSPVTQAVLRLRVAEYDIPSLGIYHVPDTTWQETGASGLVWNNMPLTGVQLVTLRSLAPAEQWLEVDVTPYVQQNGPVSFGVASENDLADRRFYSRESLYPPQLTVSSTNARPIAENDLLSASCGAPVTFDPTLNDHDPNGDAIVHIPGATTPAIDPPDNGTVEWVLQSGRYLARYTPRVPCAASDSFGYRIRDSLYDRAVGTVSVTITGTAPPPVPRIEVSAQDGRPNRDFGSTAPGVVLTRTYDVINEGTGTLLIQNVGVSPNPPFSLASAPAATVLAGGRTSFTLAFSSTALGSATGQVSVASNAGPVTFDVEAEVEQPPASPECRTPGRIIEDLILVLQGQPPQLYCWRSNPNFNNWAVGGSLNLPVISNAVALYWVPQPDKQRFRDWFYTFTGRAVGLNVPCPSGVACPPLLERLGGSELGSPGYDAVNINAIMAVHVWAKENGDGALEGTARRWLQAYFALYALVGTQRLDATVNPLLPPDQQIGPGFVPNYSGAYVALAGGRSGSDSWTVTKRTAQFSLAVGIPTNEQGTAPDRNLRPLLKTRWDAAPTRGWSMFGLSPTEAAGLRNIVETGTQPHAALTLLQGVKFLVATDLLAWPGVRASVVARPSSGNSVATLGVAYFQAPRVANGREAHMLFPWNYSCQTNASPEVCNWLGLGRGRYDSELHFIEGDNLPGSSTHPPQVARIELPAGAPLYHVALAENGGASQRSLLSTLEVQSVPAKEMPGTADDKGPLFPKSE